MVWILASIAISIWIAICIVDTTNAAYNGKIIMKEHPTLVACYDYSRGTFHTPKNDSCLMGKTMKNVYLPSKSQMVTFKQVFKERSAMYVPLALVNGESQFDPNAKSCNRYACASGIMQVTDRNGGKSMTTKQQLQWFKDRKEHQVTVGTCSRTARTNNHEMLKRCIFARHFGTLNFHSQYVNEKMDMYEFYRKLLEWKELVF